MAAPPVVMSHLISSDPRFSEHNFLCSTSCVLSNERCCPASTRMNPTRPTRYTQRISTDLNGHATDLSSTHRQRQTWMGQ
eukprot:1077366-Rhodomonas_salina.1